MKKEIIINVEEDEIRVGVLEDGQLVQIFIERPSEQSIVSNVYKGRVNSILPGMQAAFVDIGIDKAGFLHADDVLYDLLATLPGGRSKAVQPFDEEVEEEEVEEEEVGEAELRQQLERRKEMRAKFQGRRPGIQELLKKGQEIIIQVVKDPIGTKGPRLTTHLSLAGRSLVLMPLSNNVGISRRITDAERGQMKQLARKIKPPGMGLIIRTLGSGEGEAELHYEVEALKQRWHKIRRAYEIHPAPTLLYKEEALTERILRETLSKDVEVVVVDDKETAALISDYVQSFGLAPDVKVQTYTNSLPIFEYYKLEKEIEKALREKVWLHSGGYLVIEQTEALTVVDVNTGKFVGKKSQEETIFRTNIEAAVEIARQLRLRDLGGIIVIDFIDMDNPEHKEKVSLALQEAIHKDKAKTNILELTELGLVEMTRKRVKQSLVRELCQICPYCDGKGAVLSTLTVALKVLRLLRRLAIQTPQKDVVVLLHPSVAAFLNQEKARRVHRLEQFFGMRIQLKDDHHLHREDLHFLSARDLSEIVVPE